MSDHLVLCADRLITTATLESMKRAPFSEGASMQTVTRSSATDGGWGMGEFSFSDEEDAVGEKMECRICHEEDLVKRMEAPCACSGSLKLAHRKCVQRWCDEKRDTTCEICHQPYQAGYTAPSPPPPPQSEDTAIDISEGLNITGAHVDVHSPRVVAAAASEHFIDGEYDECATVSGTRTAIIRSSVLILLALLIMRHAFSLVDEDDHDFFNILSIFLLCVLAFLMPVYLLTWVATLLLRRSQRHEASRLAAAEVAIILPSGQRRGSLQFSLGSESEEPPHQS